MDDGTPARDSFAIRQSVSCGHDDADAAVGARLRGPHCGPDVRSEPPRGCSVFTARPEKAASSACRPKSRTRGASVATLVSDASSASNATSAREICVPLARNLFQSDDRQLLPKDPASSDIGDRGRTRRSRVFRLGALSVPEDLRATDAFATSALAAVLGFRPRVVETSR